MTIQNICIYIYALVHIAHQQTSMMACLTTNYQSLFLSINLALTLYQSLFLPIHLAATWYQSLLLTIHLAATWYQFLFLAIYLAIGWAFALTSSSQYLWFWPRPFLTAPGSFCLAYHTVFVIYLNIEKYTCIYYMV